jgi:uncharacterized protein
MSGSLKHRLNNVVFRIQEVRLATRIGALCCVLAFLGVSYSVFASRVNPWKAIQIQTSHDVLDFKVEVAKTEAEQMRGLMFRKSLEEGKGMLFAFDLPYRPTFWMKNTLIPLDMLFVGKDLKIKDIAANVPPCPAQTVCPLYTPQESVLYVLELNGGAAQRQKIEVGDSLALNDALN